MPEALSNISGVAHVQQTRYEWFLVDVPRFELGNRNAERIRCFILGFQVAERLAAWNNTRYGGGL